MSGGWEALSGEACKAIFSHCAEGLIFTDPETGQILAANPAACRLLGRSEEDLQGLGREDILDPVDQDRWAAALAERARSGYVEAELFFRRGDASTFLAAVTSAVFRDAAAAEMRGCLILRDITVQRVDEAALRASEQLFRSLIATSNDAFVAMDAEGQIREWNHQAEVLFGWDRHDVIGRPLGETIIPPRHRDAHRQGLAHYLATGEGPVLGQRIEVEARRRDGSEFPAELTIWALDPGPRVTFNALLHDISERRRAEEELWELALVDELSGLHNRRAFTLLAEQAIKEAARAQRPVIGVFIDVDGLKTINDRHGHASGDHALRLVADALRSACRASDIIGRLGGDEFAILLAQSHEIDGIERRIRCRLADAEQAVPYPLSVSIGLASCPAGQPCHLDELFERADQAMYVQKRNKHQAGHEA